MAYEAVATEPLSESWIISDPYPEEGVLLENKASCPDPEVGLRRPVIDS